MMNITPPHDPTLQPTVSFIVPAMNEESTLQELYHGIKTNITNHARGWEIIFIDDGSTDNTWFEMSRIAEAHPSEVRALRFRRNRGKADALALGYESATGEIVFTMDADLQDDPTEIPRFIEMIQQGHDIVSGWKRCRYDPWHKVIPSRLFNAVLSRWVRVPLHDHNCGFKAYRHEVVKSLPMYGDMHRMVPSLASYEGFRTVEIPVKHHSRLHGESKYGWSRLFTGFFDTATVGLMLRWREKPMQLVGIFSLAFGVLGIGLLIMAVSLWLAGSASAEGIFNGACIMMCSAALGLLQGFAMEHRVYYGKLADRAPRPCEQAGGIDLEVPDFTEQDRETARKI